MLDQTGIDGEVTAMTANDERSRFSKLPREESWPIHSSGGVACLFRKHEFQVDSGFKGAQQAAKLGMVVVVVVVVVAAEAFFVTPGWRGVCVWGGSPAWSFDRILSVLIDL